MSYHCAQPLLLNDPRVVPWEGGLRCKFLLGSILIQQVWVSQLLKLGTG